MRHYRRTLGLATLLAVAAVWWAGCGDNGTGTPGDETGTEPDTAVSADSGRFADARDGQAYKWVKIGEQVWMAQNLNYKPESGNSWCYDNADTNCAKYGRLYDWETAMAACPAGWRLPDTADWNRLVETAGGYEVAGGALKATSGWDEYQGQNTNGTDVYGFSALPGGNRTVYFDGIGRFSEWWTATEYSNGRRAAERAVGVGNQISGISGGEYIDWGFSTRCVKTITQNSLL